MAFIKQESEDIKIVEVYSLKPKDAEQQTEPMQLKEESQELEESEVKNQNEKDHDFKTTEKSDCYICRRRIGVASKTCQHCSAKQPYKQKLEKKKTLLSQEWIDRQKKNSSVNKVYDATTLLLHKWALPERFPVLLLARRSSSGFSTECFCLWKTDTEHTHTRLF
ncbi:unnamed protein product [Leuciscus chuanchicus]